MVASWVYSLLPAILEPGLLIQALCRPSKLCVKWGYFEIRLGRCHTCVAETAGNEAHQKCNALGRYAEQTNVCLDGS